ncbi:hypothetical protein ACFX5D_02995 [Flavobacterium sp. LB3P45]|uniref:Outer membrane lipoprotein-sorting protein n=1 Tax=Flavobacterium fructosi TaxID=3230416 RepID=A0ABW6HIT5_9FLAO
MKKLNLFVIATVINLLSSNLFAQNVTDTIFLLKEKSHNIFIEPNNNSVNYDYLLDFSSFPKKSKTNKNKILNLPTKWIPIYLYNNNYYLYRPCNLGTSSRISFSNNKIAFDGFEIYSFEIDSKIKKIENSYYKFTYKNPLKEITNVEIHIIDKQKGIAVFKFISNTNQISYDLMLDSEKIKAFSIIVNNCEYERTEEVVFDKLNFEELLNRKNN